MSGSAARQGRTGRIRPYEKFRDRRLDWHGLDETARLGRVGTVSPILKIEGSAAQLGRVGRNGLGFPKKLGIGGSIENWVVLGKFGVTEAEN